jgi:hypothetical protein
MSGHPSSVMELAECIGGAWGGNCMDGFVALFTEDAEIVHPFFRDPIPPSLAADVLNATVCGSTVYRGFVLLEGDASGENAVIDMYFDETGQAAGYQPNYLGRMAVRGYIRARRFQRLLVHGYELIQRAAAAASPFPRIDVGTPDTAELTKRLGDAWGSNDMQAFTSFFAEDGLIMHPLFRAPITPLVASDVLNSAMRGTTIARRPKLIVGDGSGKFDVVDMFFDETGDQAGRLPAIMGVMHCTAKVVGHRIQELYVHGYTAEPSRFAARHLLPAPASSLVEEAIPKVASIPVDR